MAFFYVLLFLWLANIAMITWRQKGLPRHRWLSMVHIMAIVALVGGYALTLRSLLAEGPTPADHPSWLVWGTLLTGTFSAVAFGEHLVRAAQGQRRAAGMAFGLSVLSCAAAAYLVFTALDHWWFFRDDNAGVAQADMLGLTELTCDNPLLIRMEGHDDGYLYRCPEIALANGSYVAMPFAPWPYYHQGRSRELQISIDQMMETAIGGRAAPEPGNRSTR